MHELSQLRSMRLDSQPTWCHLVIASGIAPAALHCEAAHGLLSTYHATLRHLASTCSELSLFLFLHKITPRLPAISKLPHTGPHIAMPHDRAKRMRHIPPPRHVDPVGVACRRPPPTPSKPCASRHHTRLPCTRRIPRSGHGWCRSTSRAHVCPADAGGSNVSIVCVCVWVGGCVCMNVHVLWLSPPLPP